MIQITYALKANRGTTSYDINHRWGKNNIVTWNKWLIKNVLVIWKLSKI